MSNESMVAPQAPAMDPMAMMQMMQMFSGLGARNNANALIDDVSNTQIGRVTDMALALQAKIQQGRKQLSNPAKFWYQDPVGLASMLPMMMQMMTSGGMGMFNPSVAPPPAVQHTVQDVDTLAQLVMKLSKRSDEQSELLVAMKAKLDTL